mgnify:CR=1 FL=1
MILRRVIAHFRKQEWSAIALVFLAAHAPAGAEPMIADELPQSLLAACDARAAPFGAYAAPIARSVAALDAMGVFRKDEFSPVRIGFCDLVAAGGPVAAASCASDIILLDAKYAAEKEALVLNATLAHEMKHHLQHRALRASHGDDYCESPRYAAGKAAMEEEADAFGDAVGELFVLGREIEIVNRCADPLAIYLEADDPATAPQEPAFDLVAPQSSARSGVRARSSRVFYYAETRPAAGAPRRFDNSSSPHRRFIDGRSVRLKPARLASAGREAGPFLLDLSCAPDQD